MMMKKLTLIMAGLLAAATLWSQPAPKERGTRRHGDQRMERKAHMEERLGLTTEQKSKIEELRTAHKGSVLSVRNNLDIKHAELRALIASSDTPEKKQLDRLITEINLLDGEIFKKKIEHRIEVRSLLDDKQKILFDEMERHRKRIRKRNF